MIDFSTLQGLTISEGVVTQIADELGNVLWSADDGMRDITISILSSNAVQYASIEVDGVVYGSTMGSTVISVPVGTVAKCKVTKYNANATASIKLNGAVVVDGSGSYDHVITRKTTLGIIHMVSMVSGSVTYNTTITITEEPVTFTINGTEYSAYPSMTWNDWNVSDFNTTGQKVASVTDANGNSVSLDSVIVDGTAYEVGFEKPMVTVTLETDLPTSSSNRYSISYASDADSGNISSAGSYELPIGTNIFFEIVPSSTDGKCYLYINEEMIVETDELTYSYTLTTNIGISYRNTPFGGYFYITET